MAVVQPADPFTATADRDRLAVHDALVADGPVHRALLPSGATGWLVTGYDEARALLTDPRVVKGGPGHGPFLAGLPPDVGRAIDRHLLTLDPPDHARLRRLVSAAFTRRRSELLAPRVREIADGLLGALAARPDGAVVDLVAAYAYPLPLTVICELLGIPEADRAEFRAWTGPLVAGVAAGYAAYAAAATALVSYVRDLLERKRAAPADDLLSALVAVHDGEDRTASPTPWRSCCATTGRCSRRSRRSRRRPWRSAASRSRPARSW